MNNIKKYREATGKSQMSIAEHMGVTQQAVAKWETGEALPRADKLPQLAEVLGVTVDELLRE